MTSEPITRYSIHGVRLAMAAEPRIADALQARLECFEAPEDGPSDWKFDFCSQERLALPTRALPVPRDRVIYEFGKCAVRYDDNADTLSFDWAGRLEAVCDLGQGRARVNLSPLNSQSLYLAAHPIFTISLMELLKRRELYSLHAAGLCSGAEGLLLVGPSGCGKSTLALALTRAGFGFMGDDLLFLSRGEPELRLHAFPDTIGLGDSTARLLPEFEPFLQWPKPEGWPKRQIPARTIANGALVWECRPSVLVFPTVAHTETSRLEAMTPDEALLELTPNVLLTDAASSQAHLDVLSELARQCPCYRLLTGRDFSSLPRRLEELLTTDRGPEATAKPGRVEMGGPF